MFFSFIDTSDIVGLKLKIGRNQTSGSLKNELQEVSKSNGTNTYISDTDISNTDLSLIPLEYDKIEPEEKYNNIIYFKRLLGSLIYNYHCDTLLHRYTSRCV